MKFLVVLCVLQFVAVNCKVLPDYLPSPCRKSDPQYAECLKKALQKAIPQLTKGIPELNFPGIDPFELPLLKVDRTINNGLVSVNAVLKDIKMTGASNVIIESIKADPNKMTGEIKMTIPWAYLTAEHDASGNVLIIPVNSKGFFRGNFTNTQIHVKGAAKLVEKNGTEYFKVDKMNLRIRVDDGWVKLTSKNPNLQFAADLISNFFNENPRRFMDAINPIFTESASELYRVVLDQMLASLPANELLPA